MLERRYHEKMEREAYQHAALFDFPIHKPYFQLSQEQKDLLWKGNSIFMG
jgi:excinuclease ABC subunit A